MMNAMKRMMALRMMVLVMAAIMVCHSAGMAHASSGGTLPTVAAAGSSTTPTCTNFQDRMNDIFTTTAGPLTPGGGSGKGILTQIYTYIKDIVDDATKTIFESFTKNAGYQQAVYGATILSVILFGVFFTIGLVQLTAGQLLVRLFKIGIIFSVASPTGWTFFSQYAVKFFNDGTDEIVMGVLNIATGGTVPAGASPFYQLDKLGEFLINPQTLTMIVGSLTSGPFGMGMFALTAIGFGAFLRMLINALRSYAVCFVVRSLLLGLAPIFIVFLLFERTKQLFNTWLNSLISCSLQPILLFTFLAFFTVMLESATKNMFSAELCFTEFVQGTGSSNRISGWRFVDPVTGVQVDEDTWMGNLGCLFRSDGTLAAKDECPEFPIKIIDVLTFVMLIFLASRFSEVIDRIANELSSTFIALDPAGKMDQFMSELGNGGRAGAPARGSGSGGGGGGGQSRT